MKLKRRHLVHWSMDRAASSHRMKILRSFVISIQDQNDSNQFSYSSRKEGKEMTSKEEGHIRGERRWILKLKHEPGGFPDSEHRHRRPNTITISYHSSATITKEMGEMGNEGVRTLTLVSAPKSLRSFRFRSASSSSRFS